MLGARAENGILESHLPAYWQHVMSEETKGRQAVAMTLFSDLVKKYGLAVGVSLVVLYI
ncbi:unnamed protein product, partial [marine sediment metagenome]